MGFLQKLFGKKEDALPSPVLSLPAKEPDDSDVVDKPIPQPKTRHIRNRELNLSIEGRAKICGLSARFYSVPEIQRNIKVEFGEVVSEQKIRSVLSASQLLVEKFRAQYVEAVSHIPLFHQRVRLERLEQIWEKVENEKESRVKRQELLSILREAREQVEKVAPNISIAITQFNQMTDEELLQMKTEVLGKLKEIQPKNGNGSIKQGEIIHADNRKE